MTRKANLHDTGLIASIPGSKSITNRALLAAAATNGVSTLHRPLISSDTVAFARGLEALGYTVDLAKEAAWSIQGVDQGPIAEYAEVDCVDAGTAARFLPSLAATGQGRFRFDGSDQLRRRPLRPLLDVLGTLGAKIEYPLSSPSPTHPFRAGSAGSPRGGGRENDLPFELIANGLAGGEIELDAGRSSQYLTGLLLTAPLMHQPLRVHIQSLVSRPYIAMTIGLMKRFGVHVQADQSPHLSISVQPGTYQATELDIEPDASTASYFFAAAALTGQTLTVPGLSSSSLQGDLKFVDVLARMGAKVEISPESTTVTGPQQLHGDFSVNMGDISDTFMTLACLAPFADGPVHIHGIAHARLKESDRIEAVAQNLRSCGVEVEDGPDWIRIYPDKPTGALIQCHRDHRIAMSFSVLGLATPNIQLDDPNCVSKTFPGFHEEFRRLFS